MQRTLGFKRQLEHAVLSHPSGAKAETLYHQASSSTDALVEAAVATTPLDREVDVWYQKNSVEKAPEVARDAEGYPVEARRRLEILKDGQVRDLDTKQLFKQKTTKDGVRLVPIFPHMDWKSKAGFEAVKLLLDCVGLKDQYTLVMDDETKTPMTFNNWKRVCTGIIFKPFIFCNQCQQTCDSTAIHDLRKGRGVGCGCGCNKRTDEDRQKERAAAWNAFEALGLGLDSFGRGVLTKQDDGTVEDARGRIFEPRKTHNDVRLVPIFSRTKWKTETGFEAVKLLLDCLGETGRFTLVVDEETKAPMNLDQWKSTCTGSDFKPFIFCGQCNQTSSSTDIHSLQQGHGVGCGCVAQMNLWVDRYDEFERILERDNMCLVTTRADWNSQCTSSYFKPTIKCTICGVVCNVTTIHRIQQGQRIDCACNPHRPWSGRMDDFVVLLELKSLKLRTSSDEWAKNCTSCSFKPAIECTLCGQICHGTMINSIQQGTGIDCACNPHRPWSGRMDEFVVLLELKSLKLITTIDEWAKNCTGCEFKPTIECTVCGQICNGSRIGHINQGGGIDCACINKTEGKLFTWLQKYHSDVRHNMHKLKNPKTVGTMSVDFDVPSRMLAIELDGNIKGGHFDPDPANQTPHRDLEKERQMRAKGFQMIRVYQPDVWNDQHGWASYLLRETERWRLRHEQGLPAEPARCPDAPVYLGGIYAELRK